MKTISKTYHLPLENHYSSHELFSGVLMLHDKLESAKRDELQWYYHDLYQFFLYKLTHITHDANTISETDHKKMLSMLEEIMTVKNLLEEKDK
jgi:hypothetical protein